MTGTAYVPSWQAYIEAGEHRTGLVLKILSAGARGLHSPDAGSVRSIT